MNIMNAIFSSDYAQLNGSQSIWYPHSVSEFNVSQTVLYIKKKEKKTKQKNGFLCMA